MPKRLPQPSACLRVSPETMRKFSAQSIQHSMAEASSQTTSIVLIFMWLVICSIKSKLLNHRWENFLTRRSRRNSWLFLFKTRKTADHIPAQAHWGIGCGWRRLPCELRAHHDLACQGPLLNNTVTVTVVTR